MFNIAMQEERVYSGKLKRRIMIKSRWIITIGSKKRCWLPIDESIPGFTDEEEPVFEEDYLYKTFIWGEKELVFLFSGFSLFTEHSVSVPGPGKTGI
jgi:hypothetical protein